ncbi:hypothetical protein SAMN06272759_1582 [Novosphingobium sp. B1]|nr:hypothetical protein SAMN06272759_1582 [Novosphingobium sp. B1]
MPKPAGYPMAPIGIAPQSWDDRSVAWDLRDFSEAEVQFVGTIATPYQPQRSLDGTNYVNCRAYDEVGTSYSTIAVAGIYVFDGGGYLKFSAGAGAALTRRASA